MTQQVKGVLAQFCGIGKYFMERCVGMACKDRRFSCKLMSKGTLCIMNKIPLNMSLLVNS